jgi:hypothetical protein
MTAGLPRSRLGAAARTPLPISLSFRTTGLSTMDWVRGSYDITNAKYGLWRYRAGGAGVVGRVCRRVGPVRIESLLVDDADGARSG